MYTGKLFIWNDDCFSRSGPNYGAPAQPQPPKLRPKMGPDGKPMTGPDGKMIMEESVLDLLILFILFLFMFTAIMQRYSLFIACIFLEKAFR